MIKKTFKAIKKFWNFIWHGEGTLSWVSFIIFSFIFLSIAYPLFIKFIGIFGVADIVAVVSGSMLHTKDIEITSYFAWLERNGFELDEINSWPFPNGLSPGDAVIVIKTDPDDIEVGDVIVFKNDNVPIIHRVIEIQNYEESYIFTTKGDANSHTLSFERDIRQDSIVGKAYFSIPFIGIPKFIVTRVVGVFI